MMTITKRRKAVDSHSQTTSNQIQNLHDEETTVLVQQGQWEMCYSTRWPALTLHRIERKKTSSRTRQRTGGKISRFAKNPSKLPILIHMKFRLSAGDATFPCGISASMLQPTFVLRMILKLWIECMSQEKSYVFQKDSKPSYMTQKLLSENFYDVVTPNMWYHFLSFVGSPILLSQVQNVFVLDVHIRLTSCTPIILLQTPGFISSYMCYDRYVTDALTR